MSRRILVLGSGGRLGAALVREWQNAGDEVSGLNRQQLDIGNLTSIRETLEPLKFDVVVNCAALTNVDYCETHGEEAFRINGDSVGAIAEICTAKNARCIHISTDYVFDGNRTEPYREEDAALPISVYGTSKLRGESALLAVSPDHLAVRVSWVFGPDRPSFVDQILKRALENDTAQAIADKVAVPTYTVDAARLLRPLLEPNGPGGVLHLCNRGACTWQEYGQFALDRAADAGVTLRATKVFPQQMADLTAFIAKRPVYTAMDTSKLAQITGESPRSWEEAVAEYVQTDWAPKHR